MHPNQRTQPMMAELWAMVREQQRRIEELEQGQDSVSSWSRVARRRAAVMTAFVVVGALVLGLSSALTGRTSAAPPDPHWWSVGGNTGTDPSTQFLGTVDNQRLVIKTNNAEVMRIQTDGNVGIGTTGPGSKLSVAGLIESLSGGLKFPDGSIQTTAAATGVTAVTATAPLISSGGSTPNLSLPQAGAAGDGYLSSGDWNSFNNKVSGVGQDVGITIGGTSSIPIVGLDPAYRLPQGCADDKATKWNQSASAWECADDTDTTYTAGPGLHLNGTEFSVNNQASDPTRLRRWADQADVIINAGGSGSVNLIDPGIEVTVPAGQAHYYQVLYRGLFSYAFDERIPPNTGFHADWTAELLDNVAPVSMAAHVVNTGRYFDWAALGGNQYWRVPYTISWWARLEEGTHQLKVQFVGYSEQTMQTGHLGYQRFEAMRVY